MANLLDEKFESGTDGATLTTSNTLASLISSPAPTFSTIGAGDGSLSMAIVHTTAASKFYQKQFTLGGLLYVRHRVYLTALPGAVTYVGNLLSTSTIRANWRINTNGTLRARNGTVAVGVDSTVALSLNTLYQVIWKVDNTNSVQSLTLYASDGTLLWTSGDVTYNSGTFDRIQIGATTSVANQAMYLDSIYMDDAANPGPVVGTPVRTADFIGSGTLTATAGQASAPVTASFTGSGTLSASASVGVSYGTLGWIGDSLTYQDGPGNGDGGNVENSLVTQGWVASQVQVNGEIGRPIVGTVGGTSMESVIDAWRAASFDPDSWVLELGSNNTGATDTSWRTWIGQALTKVASGPKSIYHVWWISIAFRSDIDNGSPGGVADRFLQVLKSIIPPSKIQLHIVDYNTLIRPYDPSSSTYWLSSDSTGRHMTTSGYTLRNSLIAPQIVGPNYVVPQAVASFAASGSLTASLIEREVSSAGLNGSGTLSATVVQRSVIIASFGASGQLSCSYQVSGGVFSTTANFGSSGSLAVASVQVSAQVNFSASGSTTVTTSVINLAQAQFSNSGELSAVVFTKIIALAQFSAQGSLLVLVNPVAGVASLYYDNGLDWVKIEGELYYDNGTGWVSADIKV